MMMMMVIIIIIISKEIKEQQEQPYWELHIYLKNYYYKRTSSLSCFVTTESCKIMYPRNMLWFRYIILNNLDEDDI
jgi:hypothetical protein